MTCIARRNGRRIASFQTTTARMLLTTAVALAAVLPALPAQAAPDGGVITAGAGTISRQGATTTINQSATQPQGPARMVINWNSFSSAAGESIVFNQPNAAAIALNRVTGVNPSQLMGNLTANGQVFILNPNGVLFGAGSQVNVRGLLASTLGMDTAGFMAGSYALQGSSSARVVNQGALKAADGGYIALIGPTVVNDGSISASKGDALLAAGDKVTLRLEGGSLLGYSMDLGSANALVDNTASGVISASGGRVVLEARAADTLSKAVVNHAGLIEAQTLDGSKGSIRLVGDMNVGQANVSGTLDASAPNGGDGGFIETSAARVKIADGTKVSTMAVAGTLGKWLIDPIDFEIAPGTGAQTNSSIGAATLAAALGSSNTTIGTTTSNAGSGQGDITVNADVAWQGFGKLTLQAHRNIIFNASLAGASMSLLYGQASPTGEGADFYFNNGAKIFLNGVGGTFSTQKGSAEANLKNYTIVRSLGTEGTADRSTLQGVFSPDVATNYALGADITDAATTGTWFGGQGFSPLASLFGTFEGLGHQISGLTINRPKTDFAGLFFVIERNGAVRNLALDNANITGGVGAGGISGQNLGAISRSFVSGSVTGASYVGGLAGQNRGDINASFSSARVSGDGIVGGLVGSNGMTLGNADSGKVVNSYTTGIVTGRGEVGGLAGDNLGTIRNSYSQAEVNAQRNVGGLVGSGVTGSAIVNSYATGKVTGTDANSTRGLVGTSGGGVTNSYWNTDAVGGTGQTAAGVGEGKTGAQLRQAATFSNWELATTGGTGQAWRIYEGNSMPLLRSLLAPLVLDTMRSEYSAAIQQGPAVLPVNGRSGVAATGRDAGTYLPYSTSQQGYDISNGELVITPKALVIDAQIATKIYNSATDAKATFTDNRIAGDTLTIASSSASFRDKNAGVDKPVTVSGITVTGANAKNYAYQTDLSATGTITPLNLVYIIGGVEKVYDGKTGTGVLISGNQIGGDKVFVGYSGNFVDKNVGVAKTVTVTDVRLSGDDAPNYTHQPQQLSTTASITQRPLNVTATAADKVYDATSAALPILLDNRIAGDVLVAKAVASFEDKNAGAGKKVTVSGVVISGTDAPNYLYKPQVINTSASITQRPIDITATAADKVYDGTVAALSALQDTRIAGDVLEAKAVVSFDDKNHGAGKKVTVSGISISGTDATNYFYKPQVITTTASITPRPLAIIATAADKVYDGTTSALPILQDNRVAGDVLVANAVASFNDRNAGAGKNVTVSGISIAGADAANYLYKPQVATTTASITPRPIDITATAADKAYDGTTPTSATLADNRLVGDAVSATYQRADFTDKNGGEKKTVTISGIALTGADAPNYQANSSSTASASIKPISLTIAGNADTRLATGVPYQGGNGVTYAGFIPGETAAVLAGQLRYSGDAQGAMKEGIYRITPGGLTSLNYASTFVDGALTIQPLPLGAGLVAAYTAPALLATSPHVARNTGAGTLQVVDCGMRLPENLLLGGCQPASRPNNPGQ